MKRLDSLRIRAGFTIIELLVVIGILGILLAALLPMVGSSRDSALTAKCKNNMKNLAMGVLSCAQGNDEYGHFPAAGYYRSIEAKSRKKSYYPHRSWISNKGDIPMLNRSTGSVYLGEVAHFTDSEDDVRNAVTNGAIWHAAGASFEIYRCPVHAREYEKQNGGRQPGWSFMMNQEFGFNRDGVGSIGFFGASIKSAITVSTETNGKRNDKTNAQRGHDKVLLFAEIQCAEVNDTKHGVSLKPAAGGTETDAVLEYTKENMGFNHKIGKTRYGGNVAFADGHVDMIMMPTAGGYIRDLTRYLCQGFAVPHDGSSYTPSNIEK